MRNAIAIVLLAASSIVLYRRYNSKPVFEIQRWPIPEEEPSQDRFFRKCTFPSCYETSRCLLNPTRVTIYLQPLVEFVDKNGTVISPQFSREFLKLRSAFAPYSVDDVNLACVSFPGVDFLNFDRFRSESDVKKIIFALKTRLPNIIIINFLGKVPNIDAMLLSSLPTRALFRPQFDLALPLIIPQTDYGFVETAKTGFLLTPLINVSGSQKEIVLKQLGETKSTFVTECSHSPERVCNEGGVEVDIENLIKEHKFILILDSSSIFPRLLTLSLKYKTVPVIFGDYFVLPYNDIVDWSRYVIAPTSLSRLPHILGRLSTDQVEEMTENGRALYDESFSSPDAVAKTVMKSLERLILPFISHKQNCTSLLPHIVNEPTTCSFVVGQDIDIIRKVNLLCSFASISKIVVVWINEDNPPFANEWVCDGKPIIVTYGGTLKMTIGAALVHQDCNVICYISDDSCSFEEMRISEAVQIWQNAPHAIVHLPSTSKACRPLSLLHSFYVSHCFSEEELVELGQAGTISRFSHIYLTEQEDNDRKAAKMKTTMIVVAVIYLLLIFNFYHKSNGFVKFYDEFYAYWKIIPLMFLVVFTYLHQIGMSTKESQIAAIGLAFGAVGDYLIGASHDGIVTGAIAFGLGHLSYLSLFARRTQAVHVPTAIGVLSWGAVIGHICLMPMITQQPIAVGIMTLYSLTLSTCLILSASQYLFRSEKDSEEALFYRLLGFGLFFVSDSSLILHHTGHSVPLEEILILGTYFTSQYFILHSFVSQAIHNNAKKTN